MNVTDQIVQAMSQKMAIIIAVIIAFGAIQIAGMFIKNTFIRATLTGLLSIAVLYIGVQMVTAK